MGQTSRISKNNTVVLREGDKVTVILHQTPVVTVDYAAGTVCYNNGGWVTATTVARMNQASNELNLPYRVGRRKGVMHAAQTGVWKDIPFNGYGKCVLPLKVGA